MRGKKTVVATPGAPQAIGPYSQGIVMGDLVFVSGQIGIDPSTGAMIAGGVKEQAAVALRNIGAVLSAARVGYADVVKTTVFLKDLAAFNDMNEVYSKIFGQPFPARSTVQVSALPKDALVEIEAVAVKRDGPGGVTI